MISFENLAVLLPFSLLPEKEQKAIFSAFSHEKIFKGTVLFEQEISRVNKFYTLCSGSGHYYFADPATKTLEAVLNPRDSFGGLAIFFNEGIPTRPLEILEDSIFVTLVADYFLSLCRNYTTFQEDLTNTFGRCNAQQDFRRDHLKTNPG